MKKSLMFSEVEMFPDIVWLKIFSFLPLEDLENAALLSRLDFLINSYFSFFFINDNYIISLYL